MQLGSTEEFFKLVSIQAPVQLKQAQSALSRTPFLEGGVQNV